MRLATARRVQNRQLLKNKCQTLMWNAAECGNMVCACSTVSCLKLPGGAEAH